MFGHLFSRLCDMEFNRTPQQTQEEKRFIRVSHTQESYRSMQDISGI